MVYHVDLHRNSGLGADDKNRRRCYFGGMKPDLKLTSRMLRELGLTVPSVVVDEDRARRNIRFMALRAERAGARFRPHFKTHQSGAVGRWFADEGVSAITVSSLAMAEYFAEFGWTDITLAFLLNPLELPRLGELARFLNSKGGHLGVTVDSPAAARALASARLPVTTWLKIDTGYGRTGLAWDQADTLRETRRALGDNQAVAGLLTHSGHSYQARTRQNLQAIWDTALGRLRFARDLLGQDDLLLSVGDTPCCSTVESLAGPDEVRPGNFVFYDLMQLEIGSCAEEELAAAAVCPVVGLYPERRQVVLHGGAVHLAKERLDDSAGQAVFGKLGTLQDGGGGPPAFGPVLHQAPLVTLSQEHGVVSVPAPRYEELVGGLEIGDLVLVYPVHACLTCDLHRQYHTLEGQVLPRR